MRSNDSRSIHRCFFRFSNYSKFRATGVDCFLSKHGIFLLKEEKEVEKLSNSYLIHRRFFRSCNYVVEFKPSDEIAFLQTSICVRIFQLFFQPVS